MSKEEENAWVDPRPLTVSWTASAVLYIGHHRCDWCRRPTPVPTSSQLIAFARERPDSITVWPFESPDDPGAFIPPGWTKREGLELCGECTQEYDRAVADAAARRRCHE